MENILGFVPIPSIVIICYLAAEFVKATNLNSKCIPIVCGLLGSILGIVGMFVVPNFPATDVLTALALGIVSGLSATGVNQIYKQFKSNGE